MNTIIQPAVAPVEALPGEGANVPERGIALCLSGGGYRAMLFHTGAIWRLVELGLLGSGNQVVRSPDGTSRVVGTLQRISSVSGGSLTAGVLGLK
jgi:NTE family protein